MKVTQITPLNRKKDNMPYWKVQLEGKELPLLDFEQPSYNVGDDMPEDGIKMHQSGNYYMPNRAKPGGSSAPKGEKYWTPKPKDPADRVSIERQSTGKMATDIYVHSTETGVPWNPDLWRKIFRDLLEIMGKEGKLISEAVDAGAVITEEQ